MTAAASPMPMAPPPQHSHKCRQRASMVVFARVPQRSHVLPTCTSAAHDAAHGVTAASAVVPYRGDAVGDDARSSHDQPWCRMDMLLQSSVTVLQKLVLSPTVLKIPSRVSPLPCTAPAKLSTFTALPTITIPSTRNAALPTQTIDRGHGVVADGASWS